MIRCWNVDEARRVCNDRSRWSLPGSWEPFLNKILPVSAHGQLKEHVGFLVSGSLTLPATPSNEPHALFDDFPYTQKKKQVEQVVVL